MSDHQHPLCTLSVRQGNVEVNATIPMNDRGFAEQLKEDFKISYGKESLAEMELAAKFMKFAAERATENAEYLDIAKALFINFSTQYLKSNNIHAITRSLSTDSKKEVMKAYYSSLFFLKSKSMLSEKQLAPAKSALFEATKSNDVKMAAIFGGQGNIEDYFDELAEIFETYEVMVKPLLHRMTESLVKYIQHPDAKVYHPKGLDLLQWLQDPESRPDSQYLISAPVSLPLIGVTQLLHYFVTFRVLGFSPEQLRNCFSGKLKKYTIVI